MSDISLRDLAELTGITKDTLSIRLRGLSARPGPRNSNLYDSRDALRRIYASETGGGEDDLDLSQERARLAKSQANITEMQEAELRNELVRASEVTTYWSAILSNARVQLLSLPKRVGHLVLGVPTLGEVENVILTEIETTLHELADFVPIPDHRHSEVVEAAAPADDEPVGGPVPAPVERNQRRTRKVADKPSAVPESHDGRGRRPKY